jgi:hypothetical protein
MGLWHSEPLSDRGSFVIWPAGKRTAPRLSRAAEAAASPTHPEKDER